MMVKVRLIIMSALTDSHEAAVFNWLAGSAKEPVIKNQDKS